MQSIPVFVISLAEAKTRRLRINRHLHSLGISYELIDGVVGAEIEQSRLEQIATAGVTPGTVGCALSHLAAFEQLLASGAQAALILEDDVVLDRRVSDLVSSKNMVVNDYCFLGCDTHGLVEGVGDRLVAFDRGSKRQLAPGFYAAELSSAPYRTHAYIVSRIAAKSRLENAYPIARPIDTYHRCPSTTSFEAMISPRLAWLSPTARQSLIGYHAESRADNVVKRILKRHKCIFPIIDLVKGRKRRQEREIMDLVSTGALARRDWAPLPWGPSDICYVDE